MSALPSRIHPWRLARSQARLEGPVGLAGRERLAERLVAAGAAFEVGLGFSLIDERRGLIEGVIRGEVLLACQRCLEPVAVPVEAPVALCFGPWPGELPEGFEPLRLEGETLELAELVEDEVLLALPDFPRHRDCRAPVELAEAPPEEPRRDNPFAELAALKRREGDER